MSSNTQPRVSVIVVNYNQGRYINQAIDSILNQTYNDYKIILVDDGSQDNSIEIIRKYVRKYPNKICFLFHKNHQNRGIYNTYELGISAAKSEYLAFIEADDRWGKNYLKRKIEILDRYQEVGVVFSRYKIVSEGLYGYDMAFRQKIIGLFLVVNRPFHNLKNLMKRNNVATFSAFITRKSLIDTITLYCHHDVVYFDWWILVQLSMRSKFYLDNKSFVFWRQHKDSTLGKQKFDLHKNRLSEFMHLLFEKIGPEIAMLDEQDKLYYLRKKNILPFFISFYQKPGIKNFLSFARLDPLWSFESMLSYLINNWKYF